MYFRIKFFEAYQNHLNQIMIANINQYLSEFASFGIKQTGTANYNSTFDWLKNMYLSLGFYSFNCIYLLAEICNFCLRTK